MFPHSIHGYLQSHQIKSQENVFSILQTIQDGLLRMKNVISHAKFQLNCVLKIAR